MRRGTVIGKNDTIVPLSQCLEILVFGCRVVILVLKDDNKHTVKVFARHNGSGFLNR